MFNDEQLAKILTERSLIDASTLQKAQQLQGTKSLYETVSNERLVAVEVLRELAEELFQIPSAEIQSFHIDAELIKLVPASMAFRNRVIPLSLNENALILGMFDPTDLLAMDEISTRTDVSINPMGVDPRELKLALEEYYGGHDELRSMDDGLLDSIGSPDVESMVDDVISELGWDEMFEGEDVPEDEAQKMRDRPTTGVFDIDSDDIEIADEESLLEGLDDPISADGVYFELDDWELDSELERSGAESSIMTKDSADVFFVKEETGGVAQVDTPATREVETFSGRQSVLTPLSVTAIQNTIPHSKIEGATQEITPNLLESIFDTSHGGGSSLEEQTASHPDEINRLTGIMKTFGNKKKQPKSGSITQQNTIAELANEVEFKIPDGVSDQHVFESVIRLLIAQGLIDKNALLELLND